MANVRISNIFQCVEILTFAFLYANLGGEFKMANEKTIALKQAKVDELAKEMKEAKIVLLTDYRGITVTDVTKLRADLRNANAEYKVIKNNIAKEMRI